MLRLQDKISKIMKNLKGLKKKKEMTLEKGIPLFKNEEQKIQVLKELKEVREDALRIRQRDVAFARRVPRGAEIIVPDYGVFGKVDHIQPQRDIDYLQKRVRGSFGYIIYFKRKTLGALCAIIVDRGNFRPTGLTKNIFLPIMPYKVHDKADVYGEIVEFYDWEPYDWEEELNKRCATLETERSILEETINLVLNAATEKVNEALNLNPKLKYMSKVKKPGKSELTLGLPPEFEEED